MTQWITDDHGNRCSVDYWGSEDAAKEALASNKDCKDCSDCSGCSRCSDCSDCSGCSGCSDCSRCSGCSRCSDCSDCSGCSGLDSASPTNADQIAKGPPPIPVIENIHVRVYEAAVDNGNLDMSAWHTCETTHCRAGWVVTLAGPAGKALERFYNTALAAMLIYDASAPGYRINPARFYDSNDDALADMKRMAKLGDSLR